ncbi:hypothetical protein PAHAL_2G090700 [Panicum hallii]|jgi:hypothetical protein|uniref:Uncharacterized protein n=1 Tax=Panicum hallii TaxID=206008 RepID=A0A2S3GXE4_9POAL|nr:uncharacterized protein LOC112879467 [Panicum hallii]PAN10383.1 hypothetical protein PAHAL_2G090700 [Panicum hallii]
MLLDLAPSTPAAMASAAAEVEEEVEEERPWPPPMRMKLAPYAMYRVFGAGPAGEKLGCAYVALHFALYAARALALSPVAERAAFWSPVHAALQCLCYAATALVACAFIRWYMAVDGVYVVEFDPPPQLLAERAAAEAEQPPSPPPPAMDMC